MRAPLAREDGHRAERCSIWSSDVPPMAPELRETETSVDPRTMGSSHTRSRTWGQRTSNTIGVEKLRAEHILAVGRDRPVAGSLTGRCYSGGLRRELNCLSATDAWHIAAVDDAAVYAFGRKSV
jgi:hypothetical protein